MAAFNGALYSRVHGPQRDVVGSLTALEATQHATAGPHARSRPDSRVWALTALNPFRSRAYVRDAVFSNNGQINGCGWIGSRQGSSSFAQISPVSPSSEGGS